MCMYVHVCGMGRSEDNLQDRFSPPTKWVLELEPRSSGLDASAFTHGAISLAHQVFLVSQNPIVNSWVYFLRYWVPFRTLLQCLYPKVSLAVSVLWV